MHKLVLDSMTNNHVVAGITHKLLIIHMIPTPCGDIDNQTIVALHFNEAIFSIPINIQPLSLVNPVLPCTISKR